MVPTALKLPLWNGPPIFLTHLGSQESKKTGETWSGEKTLSRPLEDGLMVITKQYIKFKNIFDTYKNPFLGEK